MLHACRFVEFHLAIGIDEGGEADEGAGEAPHVDLEQPREQAADGAADGGGDEHAQIGRADV